MREKTWVEKTGIRGWKVTKATREDQEEKKETEWIQEERKDD